MSIYEQLLRKADIRKKYRIDLNKKDLWIGSRHYISEGQVMYDEELISKDDLQNVFGVDIDLSTEPFDVIKYLYKKFKHSVPSERYKDNSYFKALAVKDLDDTELAFNCDRHFAQAMLEGYILLGSMIGWISWDNDNWFWQDEEDEDCIVLRDWIIRKED